MMDLTGYLKMDAVDVFTAYGAFLYEEEGGHVNMDALLRMPKAKEVTKVDFRERNGVELPTNPNLKWNAINRTLRFMIIATTEAERLSKYQSFLTAVTAGMKTWHVKGYRNYKMLYQDMTEDPKWYNSYDGQHFAVAFSITFLEPAPTI